MKRNQTFSFWGFVISALILVFFAVQNAKEVDFEFFVWETRLSLSVLLIVAFLFGLIAGAIFSFRQSKQVTNENEKKENEKKKRNEDAGLKNNSPDKWNDLEDIDVNRD